jgi:hypothetical protein
MRLNYKESACFFCIQNENIFLCNESAEMNKSCSLVFYTTKISSVQIRWAVHSYQFLEHVIFLRNPSLESYRQRSRRTWT